MLLHILWMILKIILILLGVLLGLLLLVILLVLFCPVRYCGLAAKEGSELKDIRGEGSLSWLFHGIWVKFYYADQKFTTQIKIFGISLDWLKKVKGNFSKRKKKRTQNPPQKQERPKSARKPEREKQLKTAPSPKTEKTQKAVSLPEKEHPPKREPQPEKRDMPEEEKEPGFILKIKNIKNKIAAIWEKRKLFEKIRQTLKNFWDRLSWWKSLWDDERIQAALGLVKTELKRILKHVFPTKISGEILFGSEDPAVTGMALAILGITMPLHKNLIAVNPVYEGENILEGKVILKGRIYAVVLLAAGLKIYFNKNIKYAISRWKRKEG